MARRFAALVNVLGDDVKRQENDSGDASKLTVAADRTPHRRTAEDTALLRPVRRENRTGSGGKRASRHLRSLDERALAIPRSGPPAETADDTSRRDRRQQTRQ
jgi:hypothetical protein